VKDASFYVSGLLDLAQLKQAGERRAAFRQSMAALARAVSVDEGPGPLEGVNPGALVRGVGAALKDGLVDDLDWLASSAAGPALYELASALPLGAERRDLGRRVLSRLLDGNAEAFVALATRMARTTGKGLSSAGVRARVALVTELPFAVGVADGPLALALASRRELAREWIETPSMGSLPSRRLAARLLERAAREAARRASQGDPHALRAFRVDTVRRSFARLLADRESLVWRHVAVARGLLAPWEPDLQKELDHGLDPSLSPTEWRRAATSIAAETAVDPGTALRLAAHALARGAVKRDGGVAVAFVWGAARAAEAEPEATAELVGEAVSQAPALVAEAVLELAGELGPCRVVDEATAQAVSALTRSVLDQADDAAAAVMRDVLRDLDRTPRDDEPLRQQLARALALYATEGARAAHAAGKQVLTALTGTIDALDAVSKEDEDAQGSAGALARRTSLAVLRDVDLALLERNVLGDLLALGSSTPGGSGGFPTRETERNQEEAVDEVRERLTSWILEREAIPFKESSGSAAQTTLRMRRLRALLHLVDSDSSDAPEDGFRTARLRDRWRRVARALVKRYETEGTSPLHRTVLATLVRALDALVRAEALDPADVLLVVARLQTQASELDVLAEASMDPDVVHVLARYAAFLRACSPAARNSDSLLPSQVAPAGCKRELGALDELAREIVPDGAGRREVLRTVLVRLASALHAVVEPSAPRQRSTQVQVERRRRA
jgi:eukaryotic-like serine/threonine-protein kinase